MIQVGEKLPDATFKVPAENGLADVTTAELTKGRKIVMFAVPGAFTPTCHAKHMPSFLGALDKLAAKGIDEVVCISVNDAFVLGAWAKETGAAGKIRVLADGNATFTRAIGMEFDGSGFGLGTRSKRYAMIIEDGIVKDIALEESPGVMEASSAEAVLDKL